MKPVSWLLVGTSDIVDNQCILFTLEQLYIVYFAFLQHKIKNTHTAEKKPKKTCKRQSTIVKHFTEELIITAQTATTQQNVPV